MYYNVIGAADYIDITMPSNCNGTKLYICTNIVDTYLLYTAELFTYYVIQCVPLLPLYLLPILTQQQQTSSISHTYCDRRPSYKFVLYDRIG